MSRLIEFYRRLAPDTEGRMLAELWTYTDEEMEDVHDFIQWIFPLQEPSRFNPDSPLLPEADIEAFRADPALRQSLRRSFDRFLAFLGLAIEDGHVIEGRDFGTKGNVWRFANHNWLKISRVLASTRILGLDNECRGFFAFLEHLRNSGHSGIDATTFGYWSGAAQIPR